MWLPEHTEVMLLWLEDPKNTETTHPEIQSATNPAEPTWWLYSSVLLGGGVPAMSFVVMVLSGKP